jgi:uncharacterized membrane protein YhaH (DUF805 family)
MLRFFFSFQGRLSRRQFRLGYLLISLVMFPAVVAPLLIPFIPWWVAAVICIASFSIACASAAAMSTKRAHDLGKPNIWVLWPFLPIRLFFSEGQPQDNQYGPNARPTSWRRERSTHWTMGRPPDVGLDHRSRSRLMPGIYRPVVEMPECKPPVTAEGVSEDRAREQWRYSAAGLYGPAYARSEMTIMQSTTCRDGVCTFSAHPCVQRP